MAMRDDRNRGDPEERNDRVVDAEVNSEKAPNDIEVAGRMLLDLAETEAAISYPSADPTCCWRPRRGT